MGLVECRCNKVEKPCMLWLTIGASVDSAAAAEVAETVFDRKLHGTTTRCERLLIGCPSPCCCCCSVMYKAVDSFGLNGCFDRSIDDQGEVVSRNSFFLGLSRDVDRVLVLVWMMLVCWSNGSFFFSLSRDVDGVVQVVRVVFDSCNGFFFGLSNDVDGFGLSRVVDGALFIFSSPWSITPILLSLSSDADIKVPP